MQEILAEPCQHGERGGAEYGGSSGPPFAENRPSAGVGARPSPFAGAKQRVWILWFGVLLKWTSIITGL